MKRNFYAFSWRNGKGKIWSETGLSAGIVYVFSTKKERDRWVADGPDYQTENGYREDVSASWVRKNTREWSTRIWM